MSTANDDSKTQGEIPLWLSVAILALVPIVIVLLGGGKIVFAVFVGCGLIFLITKLLPAAPDGRKPVRASNLMSLERLRTLRERLGDSLSAFSRLEVFRADDAELAAAWARKNTARIEELLRKGDALTRSNWKAGIRLYNDAAKAVDLARGKMAYLLTKAEGALAPFAIDYASIAVGESKLLRGSAPSMKRQRRVAERLNYCRGAGITLARGLNGQISGPAALAVSAGLLIHHAINQSKILRQLKEVEGKLKANATAAKGDFRMFQAVLKTRILPQFDGLLAIAAKLESELAALGRTNDIAAPEQKDRAFRLACALLEGKQLLELTAGD
ncbi:MAG: hypothetical protein WDN01_16850 [Rhizomicrobium sp.]